MTGTKKNRRSKDALATALLIAASVPCIQRDCPILSRR